MPDFDPAYAPPRARPSAPTPALRFDAPLADDTAHRTFTLCYAAVNCVEATLITVAWLGELPESAAAVMTALVALTWVVSSVFLMIWWYSAWSAVSYSARERLRVTPGTAVVYMFIPFYNLYWAFAVARRLADAINLMRVEVGLPSGVGVGNAYLATGLFIVGRIFVMATAQELGAFVMLMSAAWQLAFMLRCDRSLNVYHLAKRDTAAALA